MNKSDITRKIQFLFLFLLFLLGFHSIISQMNRVKHPVKIETTEVVPKEDTLIKSKPEFDAFELESEPDWIFLDIGHEISAAADEWELEPVTHTLPACITIYNEDRIDAVANYWYRIPKYYRDCFENDGWHMYILCGEWGIENYYCDYNRTIGATEFDRKICLVEDTDIALLRALIHEFGHYWDWHRNLLSYWDDSWQNYFLAERYTIDIQNRVDNHAIINATEFFAEVFCQGILYPEICEATAPMSFAYVFNS